MPEPNRPGRPVVPLSSKWQSFRSTCFSKARWNHETLRLEVVFAEGDGTEYAHDGFPEMQWLLFKSAPSHGKFWHRFIKNKYPRK